MTIERLHNYRLLLVEKTQIRALLRDAEERIQELRTAATSIGGGGDGMPHVRAGHPDSKLIASIGLTDKAEEDYRELIAHYIAKLAEIEAEQLAIEAAVDALPPREACVIRAKYLEELGVDEICTRYGFSRRTVYRLFDSAKELLERG